MPATGGSSGAPPCRERATLVVLDWSGDVGAASEGAPDQNAWFYSRPYSQRAHGDALHELTEAELTEAEIAELKSFGAE